MSTAPYHPPDESQTLSQLDERRALPRFPAKAKALIIRDTDLMRTGINARLHDVSASGLGLTLTDTPPDLGEVVQIHLENEIQRFRQKVRGIIRHVTAQPDGTHRVGVELFRRLTPFETSLLKINDPASSNAAESEDNGYWV